MLSSSPGEEHHTKNISWPKPRLWQLVSVILGLSFVLLPLLPIPSETALIARLWGKMHPILVHFPIVLIALPLILEVLASLFGKILNPKGTLIILILAWTSGLLALVGGFNLYVQGSYQGNLISQHFWGGVLLMLLLMLTIIFFVHLNTLGKKWYLGTLIITNFALLLTGHWGGSLTHGEDFISEAFQAPIELISFSQEEAGELRAWESVIMPVIKQKCQSCHNENKTKGDLLLTSLADITKGGRSGKSMIVPFKPDQSEFLVRMNLPDTVDEHMPPIGKPQMPEKLIDLIDKWILAGGNDSLTLSHIYQNDSIPEFSLAPVIADKRDKEARKASLKKVLPAMEALAREQGLLLLPDEAQDSAFYTLSMQLPISLITDNELEAWIPFSPYLSGLSLVASEVSEDGLFYLSQFSELRKLFLQKTCINSEGIPHLLKLKQLEVLNISYTDVDEVGALYLLDMPSLKKVYVFQTAMGANVIHALRAHRPEVQLLETEGPYF